MVGRPFEVDSDQTETFTENNQHSTTRERADILKTSNSMKLFSENEKCVFYFMEKTKQTFWPTPYIYVYVYIHNTHSKAKLKRYVVLEASLRTKRDIVGGSEAGLHWANPQLSIGAGKRGILPLSFILIKPWLDWTIFIHITAANILYCVYRFK